MSEKRYFQINKDRLGANENIIPDSWPENGDITFKKVSLKNDKFDVSVLKSISFHIQAGERVAIVGRSGSGKSTMLSIFY